MTGPPVVPPIGLRLARTARVVTQAFERAMAEADGSASTWQVLLLVRSEQWGTRARIAEAMGISGSTLTHHVKRAGGPRTRPPLTRGRQPVGSGARRSRPPAKSCSGGYGRSPRVTERLRSQLTDDQTALLAELLEALEAGLEGEDAT